MNITTTFKTFVYKSKLIYEYHSFFNLLKKDTELSDFITDKFDFKDNVQPIQIDIQKSYDDSVNLILNDGINTPKLINSRFSVTGNDEYEIIDRSGKNDTNIYDEKNIISDTSLFKTYHTFSNFSFDSILNNGNLKVGNYVLYFKYSDSDGNETNIAAESNMIHVFIGYDKYIEGGYSDKNAFKSIKININNLDTSYDYINIYYSRYSSDQFGLTKTSIFKVLDKVPINNRSNLSYILTGNENIQEITATELNTDQICINSCKTQTITNNRLFLGNLSKTYIDYQELEDLSLRFIATSSENKELNPDYTKPKDIYNYTGYWPNEFYRFGIVYIYNNNTYSPVFNICGSIGMLANNGIEQFDEFNIYEDSDNQNRKYIEYNEETFKINVKNGYNFNARGVVKTLEVDSDTSVINIKFSLLYSDDVINILKKQGIIGYFFVRQKRIPTILTQGYLLKKSMSGFPLYNDQLQTITKEGGELQLGYYTPRIDPQGYCLICPEYEVRQPYFNQLFNSNIFLLKNNSKIYYFSASLIGVKDSIPSIILNTNIFNNGINKKVKFSSKAGTETEVLKMENNYDSYSEFKKNFNKDVKNHVVRGNFSPYVGVLSNYNLDDTDTNYTIYISGYNTSNYNEYIKIRASDNSPYYSISNCYNIDNKSDKIVYKGDCYICKFWHRINRNFQDPSAPNNDEIVKTNGYKDINFKDGVFEGTSNINIGDINAIQLGEWIETQVRCTCNLSIRSVDDTNPSEIALTGNARSFYPYKSMDTSGNYKIPESHFINEGFGQSLSQRYYFLKADVPVIRNNFTNQIIYSDIAINDGYQNGLRVFRIGNERNYNTEFGAITKLLSYGSSLIVIFEHGICQLQISSENNSDNEINSTNILPEIPTVISDTYGSKWIESVIQTPRGIYGIDTDAKRIWFFGQDGFKVISDYFVNSFLDKNINLNSYEKEYNLGIKDDNIKVISSHYNAHKSDVMFVYNTTKKSWNLCWNELLQRWITFYSWIPSFTTNVDNVMYSFNKSSLYKHNIGAKPCYWYDEQHPFEFEFTVIDSPLTHKIFDNMIIVSNNSEPESFHYTIIGDCYNFSDQKQFMYFRQEATHTLLKANVNKYYVNPDEYFLTTTTTSPPKRSALFPNVYYCEEYDKNTIYSNWIEMTDISHRNYSHLSGTTLSRNGQEISITEHSPARNITNSKYGRLRGNMHYREDRWFVQISPINLVYKNETKFVDNTYPQIVINNVPKKLLNTKISEYPEIIKNKGYENSNCISLENWGVLHDLYAKTREEIKLKDKYIKIKIRYKGDKQTFIHSILTKYTEVL